MCSLCTASLRGPPIGGQDRDGVPLRCSTLYTLLPLRGISPQGETRDMRKKQGSHMLHVLLQYFPLWWLAPPPFPRKRGHYKAPLCGELLMKGLLFRALFFPLNRGKSGAARIGGGERSEPVSRMVILPYDTESQSRNADFISIARRAIRHLQRRRRCRPLSEA